MTHNPTGYSQDAAAARSASFHQPMNPQCGTKVLFHTLARLLPLHGYMDQVYHLGQKHPPGFEDGYCPVWEVATAILPARTTTQLRINFQREFHLMALSGSSSAAGGFRLQIYDKKKQYCPGALPGVRLAARGVNFTNYLGTGFNPAAPASNGSAAFFLREPHPFTEKDAQAMVVVQNQDTGGVSNQIQVALYGVVRRFNYPD
jgi:hypothetical protein